MARQGFGIFNSPEMGGYGAGWCPHCGRRRGADGRCNDCDPWFTSPLVQYGGPIAAIFAAFLIVGVLILRPRQQNEIMSPGAVLSAPAASYPAMSLNAAVYQPTVQSVLPPMPKPPDPATVAASFAPYVYSPDAAQYQQLESLRQTTAYVDGQVNAARFRQEQEERFGASNLGPVRAFARAEFDAAY